MCCTLCCTLTSRILKGLCSRDGEYYLLPFHPWTRGLVHRAKRYTNFLQHYWSVSCVRKEEQRSHSIHQKTRTTSRRHRTRRGLSGCARLLCHHDISWVGVAVSRSAESRSRWEFVRCERFWEWPWASMKYSLAWGYGTGIYLLTAQQL